MLTRAKWIAGLATLGLVGAFSATALGVGFAQVKVSVPASVPLDRGVSFKVEADSSKRVDLTMFVSMHPCKTTAEAETVLSKDKKATIVVNQKIDGKFKKSFDIVAFTKGTHYACAYLHEPKITLASDTASYEVTRKAG